MSLLVKKMSNSNCKDTDKKTGEEICNKYSADDKKKHSVDELRVSGDSIVKNPQINRKMLAESYQASVLEAVSESCSPQMYNAELDQPMPISPDASSSSSASPPSYEQCINNNNNTETITTPPFNDLYTAEISNFLQNAPEAARNQLVSFA